MSAPRKDKDSAISSHVHAKKAAVHITSKVKARNLRRPSVTRKATAKLLKIEARKTIEADRDKHMENQFNADCTINALRTALEKFFTENWKELVDPVYAIDATLNEEETKQQTEKQPPVGWNVKANRVQELDAVVAAYDNDTDGLAIHSRGIFGETILHQVLC